ncbi:hypothetical protein HI113_03800 [Corallococcus exiguus]|uniref:heparin lyase I family protein n=1 Tax=Corallococcus exiguus TaxID=83462 RepID=UPI001473AAC0|nr:heparin lyase I family protein [Corallococcus exiguus]NNB93034.1 hypothetical protein [Corallococcus exiguus]
MSTPCIVWRGDFSTGDLSQWAEEPQSGPGGLLVRPFPTELRHLGNRNYLLVTVTPEDKYSDGNRSELIHQPRYGTETGTEYFCRWSTLFPESTNGHTFFPVTGDWQVITQWHQSDGIGSPPIGFGVTDVKGCPYIVLDLWQETTNELRRVAEIPYQEGVWYDFVLQVKFSDCYEQGFVNLWCGNPQVYQQQKADSSGRRNTRS